MTTHLTRLALAIVVVSTQSVLTAVAAQRPNVLLIITDDQGYGDFSSHGNPYLSTPHIDQLAKSAIQFERFFVNSFCAPTRAALLTGRYPLRCGVWGVTHGKETMRASEVTLAETLRSAGYRTGCFGKWHNGEQFPFTPGGQGFDDFVGFCNGHTNNYFDAVLMRGSKPERTKGYIADVIADEAIRFIEKEQGRPFFCYLSFNTPHDPYQVPDKYYDKFRAQGLSAAAAAFYGMCENIDANVGRVLSALKAAGVENNTIVLFMTDNGGTTVNDLYNAGMRGGKTSVHEGGTRVPLFVRWPARFPASRSISQITSHIDIYPTILDLCGVALPSNQPPLDGINLRPLLEGDTDSWPERILFTHNPISQTNRYPGAVRTPRYRLVREIVGPAGGSSAKENDASASPWQLYDMQADPAERHDLAELLPDVVAELSRRYEDWLDEVREQGLEHIPIPVGLKEESPVTLQAHQAQIAGAVRFAAGPGFAHDYLTDWRDETAQIAWEIDVAHSGDFDVAALYGCPQEDAGSTVVVTAGQESVECEIPAADAPFIPLAHRDQPGRRLFMLREWARLPMGRLHLAAGRQQLVLTAADVQGASAMDFKGLELTPIGEFTASATMSGSEPAPTNDLLEPARFIHIPGPNPLLVPDQNWDSGVIETSDAIKDGNTYYLYYHGKGRIGYQIGVATSSHPLGPFQRYGTEPLLAVGPPGSWDDKYVACAFILKERSDLYYMFYSAKGNGRDEELRRNVYDVGVATADNPLGPWTKHPQNPLIWDFGFVGSVVKHNGRYLMFNSAPLGDSGEDYDIKNRDYGPLSVAMANSPTGPWTIHPQPVMRQGEQGEWDDAGMSEAEVFFAGNVFHLFYGAATRARQRPESLESIGYAYSFDGFHWRKYGRNPVAPREAEPNAGAFAEVHTIFEPPFVYLYHTLRYEEMPEHAKGRTGFPWLEDIGVQVLAIERPFSLEMPVASYDTIAPRTTTTLSLIDTRAIAVGCVAKAAVTVECRFSQRANRGLRIHVRTSSDGLQYDTVDRQTFDVAPQTAEVVRQSFDLDTNARFVKILVENLDDAEQVEDVSLTATLKG